MITERGTMTNTVNKINQHTHSHDTHDTGIFIIFMVHITANHPFLKIWILYTYSMSTSGI